jgi:hypothetical protein
MQAPSSEMRGIPQVGQRSPDQGRKPERQAGQAGQGGAAGAAGAIALPQSTHVRGRRTSRQSPSEALKDTVPMPERRAAPCPPIEAGRA